MRNLLMLFAMLIVATIAVAQTTTTFAPPPHSFKDSNITQTQASQLMDLSAGTLRSRDTARRLLELTLKSENPSVNLDDKSFYCIINVVPWTKDPKGEYSAGKPRWYVYHALNWGDDDFSSYNRIFGVKTHGSL